MRKRNFCSTSCRTGLPARFAGRKRMAARAALTDSVNRSSSLLTTSIVEVSTRPVASTTYIASHRSLRPHGQQVGRVGRGGAALVALHHLVHFQDAEDRVGDEVGHRTEGELSSSPAPLAPRPGTVGFDPDPHALGGVEELAVLQVPAGPPPLEDVGLPGTDVHPVGWEEEEHPRLALVLGKLPAARGQDHDNRHHTGVGEQAGEGALRRLEETPMGFEQGEVHVDRRCAPHI